MLNSSWRRGGRDVVVLNADRQTEGFIQLVPVPAPGLGEERPAEHRRKHAFGCSTRTWKAAKDVVYRCGDGM